MKPEAVKLGMNVKRIRVKKGITQVHLARLLGVNKAFISNVENGKANPTLATISKLAKALGTSIRELANISG